MTSLDTVRPDKGSDSTGISGSSGRRTWTLVVACSGVALVVASMTALNTALGDIAVATSATQTQLTWVVDGYTLVLACLLLPAGAIGDRYGRRGALLTGLAVFSVASIAPLVFDSPVQVIGARAAAGLGAAFIMPATLSLLSGGEQALTALALIFAVFLTNPAPICVLDEVDAPLDDYNVERFCDLLDEMTRSTETRFIIITHNPITMARMNRLYGVTMAERGVSQLVSVDLEGAVKLREAS